LKKIERVRDCTRTGGRTHTSTQAATHSHKYRLEVNGSNHISTQQLVQVYQLEVSGIMSDQPGSGTVSGSGTNSTAKSTVVKSSTNRHIRPDVEFKLMMLGDSGVGKTAILRRYCDDNFDAKWINTIGIDFKMKNVEIEDKRVRLQIWDTAGQERFQAMAHSFYRGAAGILLVYDITNLDSFEHVEKWMNSIKTHGSDDVIVTLIGNKSDIIAHRNVSISKGQELAKQYKVDFFETSAKTTENIDDAFSNLSAKVFKKQIDKLEQANSQRKGKLGSSNGSIPGSVNLQNTLTNIQESITKQSCCGSVE